MSVLFLVLPITLLLSLGAVAAFWWATRGGQFDDLQTPAVRALHDGLPQDPSERDRGCVAPTISATGPESKAPQRTSVRPTQSNPCGPTQLARDLRKVMADAP